LNTKKRSIKQKIVTVILSISLLSLTVIILVSVLSMINMKDNITKTSDKLGQTAAKDSQTALEAVKKILKL